MANLNDIVSISITRESASVTQANFGTPAIIAEFATDKTTTTFVRYRYYASLTEMTEDGWTTSDEVYDAAAAIFAQNPKVSRVMVGRKDSADADWSTALTAILAVNTDWYGFGIIGTKKATITFDADFVTDNEIDLTINGETVTTVPFNTDNATTYTDLKDQIELDITNSAVTVDATARTVEIEIFGDSVATVTEAVTGGATQADGTITYTYLDDFQDVADWTESADSRKLCFIESTDANVYDASSETDIAYYISNNNYDRSIVYYSDTIEYTNFAAMGEAFPFNPGSQTWAYKTLSGVTTDDLTSSEQTAVLDKNANIYVEVAGVNITQFGTVGSGEYIDIMRGVDWIDARIQERIYAALVSVRKIPYTNEGIGIIEAIIRGVLLDGVGRGILVDGTIEVSTPERADVSSANRTARILPDVTFTADLAGAIHKTSISGILSI